MAEEQQAVESTDQPVEQSVEQQTEDVSRETSEQQAVMDRPEIIPEKFWNADTGEINLEDMAKSYNHLEKFASGKKDEIYKYAAKSKSWYSKTNSFRKLFWRIYCIFRYR